MNPRRLDVGVLVFEGVELLDFAGPAEVFIVADEGRRFCVSTIAGGPRVRTMGGLQERVLVTTPVARFVSAGRSRRCSTLQYFQVLARFRALGSTDTHFSASVRVTRTRS